MRRAATSNVGIWILGLGGAAAAALFLLGGKKAAAGTTPAASERNARVLQTVRRRTGAGTDTPSTGASVAGDTVRVLRTGLSGQGAREWWEIITHNGQRGFAAAINTDGTANMRLE